MSNLGQFHQFKNIFLASPISLDTDVSAISGVSLASPGAGQYLEVWQIDVDGPTAAANTATLILRDGEAGDVIRTVEVAPGDTKVITFGGLPKIFNTTMWFNTAADTIHTTVHYVPRTSR